MYRADGTLVSGKLLMFVCMASNELSRFVMDGSKGKTLIECQVLFGRDGCSTPGRPFLSSSLCLAQTNSFSFFPLTSIQATSG